MLLEVITATTDITATGGMSAQSEDVFQNRRIQLNASANDTDEGSFLLLDRTDSGGSMLEKMWCLKETHFS